LCSNFRTLRQAKAAARPSQRSATPRGIGKRQHAAKKPREKRRRYEEGRRLFHEGLARERRNDELAVPGDVVDEPEGVNLVGIPWVMREEPRQRFFHAMIACLVVNDALKGALRWRWNA
jgi:hypothetical protein